MKHFTKEYLHALTAGQVHGVLHNHMLADGFDMVLDLDKSTGPWIRDLHTGRDFFDMFSFFASAPLSMNHPKIACDEFREKMGRVAIHNPTNSDVYTIEMAKFVGTFGRVGIPDELPHLFMVSGGALAVENALKVAMDWKVQKNFNAGYTHEHGHQVLHFREAFHGRSGYTMSMTNTNDPRKYLYFTKHDWPRIINPKLAFPTTDEVLARVVKAEQLAVNQIKQALVERRDDICALIIEPIQAEGGDNHFRPEFMAKLRELADEGDFLLIFDEIQTGVGLTGNFWAYQGLGTTPDILVFGKKMQICGILAGPRVDEVERNCFVEHSRINSTWGGSLPDMVRATRYLEIIEEEGLVKKAAQVGDYLYKGLQDMAVKIPGMITNIRHAGLMAAFDLPSGDIRDAARKRMYENGLLILPCGADSLRFRPALDIKPEWVDQGLALIEKSLLEL